jgi:hypothetical protein
MTLGPDSHERFKGLSRHRGWTVAEYGLLVIWVVAAAMTMYPALGKATGLRGTFFTSYAADVANPPWIYITLRRGRNPLARFFARSPASAALSIFAVGVLSEFCQKYRPGFIHGTFDPLDIVAYGSGLLICYLIESRTLLHSEP